MHYQYSPIITQCDLLFKSSHEQRDFQGRSIFLVKMRHKLKGLKNKYFYVEMSLFKNKVYVIMQCLEQGFSWNTFVNPQMASMTVLSNDVVVLQIWRK